MRLTTRTFLASSLAVGLLVGGLGLLWQATLSSSYASFERQDAQRNMQRALAALHDGHLQLAVKATDWGFWDLMYRYVQGQEPGFVADNLVGPVTLADMDLDALAILDLAGQSRWAQGIQKGDLKRWRPFPSALMAQLRPGSPLVQHDGPYAQKHGLLALEGQLVWTLSQPITKSDHSGGIKGTLCMVRVLDAARLAKLANLTGLDLALWPVMAPQLPLEAKQALADPSGGPDALTLVLESEERLAAYAVAKDLMERPVAVLRVRLPRTIHAEGQRTMRQSLGALSLAGLLVLGLNLLLLRRVILARLERLAREVVELGQGGRLDARVTVSGQDELSETAEAVNRTMAQLQQAQEALVELEGLRKGEARFTGLMDLSPSAVVLVQDGKVAYANPVWAELMGAAGPEALVGRPWLELADPAEAQRLQAELAPLLWGEGERLQGEIRLPSPSEQGRVLEMVANRMSFQGQACLQINAQDVSLARQAQAEVARMGSELAIATHIQTALVPSGAQIPNFDLALDLVTATEVGGDLVDVLPQEGERFWLAVGDVTGHGLTPGLVMMMAQSMLTAMIMEHPEDPPSAHLVALNGALHQNVKHRLGSDHYMTLQLLRHDGGGRFTAAGMHCDVLIHRQATGRVEAIEIPGLWTGLLPDVRGMVQDTSFELHPGDVMVLYSDGLIEAMNAQDEQWDMARLEAALARNAHLSAEAIKEALLEEVRAWLKEQLDDISIVVARYQQPLFLDPTALEASQAT